MEVKLNFPVGDISPLDDGETPVGKDRNEFKDLEVVC